MKSEATKVFVYRGGGEERKDAFQQSKPIVQVEERNGEEMMSEINNMCLLIHLEMS